jgi:hypothetical protein
MLHTPAIRALRALVSPPRTSFGAMVLSVPVPVPVLTLALVLSALGCQPELPSPSGEPGGAAVATSPAMHDPEARIEPDSPLDAAPRVLRVRILPAAEAPVDPARLLFVRGHVTDALVAEVERGAVSAALAKRAVPAIAWPDKNGAAVLAPTEALDPDTTYGLLSGDPPLGVDIHVAAADSMALLARTWPPQAVPDPGRFAVFCDTSAPGHDLAEPHPHAELSPGDAGATVQRGIAGPLGARCLRVDADPEAMSGEAPDAMSGAGADAMPGEPVASSFVPPPVVSLSDGSSVRLEPRPIVWSAAQKWPPEGEIGGLACEADQIAFGPGCALVSDDRLTISTPAIPLLWAVRTPAVGEVVRATAPGQPWVLRGLRPASLAVLRVAAVDAAGRESHASLDVMTSPAAPRVILSEVLANPLGAEPDEEWVELLNDSTVPADLTGYVLKDADGSTPLPAAQLAPGAFALVVNQPFVEDDGQDPAPAPGTMILRVSKLGKGGLKNSGEPLSLVAPDGAVVSRMPAVPKTKAGQSLARVTPESPDGDMASFAAGAPTPGAPNGGGAKQ